MEPHVPLTAGLSCDFLPERGARRDDHGYGALRIGCACIRAGQTVHIGHEAHSRKKGGYTAQIGALDCDERTLSFDPMGEARWAGDNWHLMPHHKGITERMLGKNSEPVPGSYGARSLWPVGTDDRKFELLLLNPRSQEIRMTGAGVDARETHVPVHGAWISCGGPNPKLVVSHGSGCGYFPGVRLAGERRNLTASIRPDTVNAPIRHTGPDTHDLPNQTVRTPGHRTSPPVPARPLPPKGNAPTGADWDRF